MQINRLSEEAAKWLEKNQYTPHTIYCNYVRFWNGLAKSVGEGAEFCNSIAEGYIASKYGRNISSVAPKALPSKEHRAHRAFKALEEFHDTGAISGTSIAGSVVRKELPTYEKSIIESYMRHLESLGHSYKSKRTSYGIVHHYLLHCPVSGISARQVLVYLNGIASSSQQTAKAKLKAIRRFLAYCLEAQFVAEDYSGLFPPANKIRTEIPSAYTPAEITVLLDYLGNNNKNRKRNYAIALLIAFYGYRSGDIVDMALGDIDWDNGIIRIAQSKTKNVLEHRLCPRTDNALASYLLEERIDNGSPRVFLKEDGGQLNSISVPAMISNAFINCGISINGRKHGSHSLRHSLASNMLASGSGIMEVSKALGHESVEAARIYAKVDTRRLRLCELEVPADAQ